MDDKHLSTLEPCVHDSLVIFRLKKISDPSIMEVPLAKSDKRRHLSSQILNLSIVIDP